MFGVFRNDRVPERTVNRLVFEWLDALRDGPDGARAERNEIGIGAHEAKVLTVGTPLQHVAGEPRPAAVAPLSPVHDRSAIEVSAGTHQRQARGDLFGLAGP